VVARPFAEPMTENGGRGGIRTHASLATRSDFESGALNHSATLPAISIILHAPVRRASSFAACAGRNNFAGITVDSAGVPGESVAEGCTLWRNAVMLMMVSVSLGLSYIRKNVIKELDEAGSGNRRRRHLSALRG
jgi:hypothetical protein